MSVDERMKQLISPRSLICKEFWNQKLRHSFHDALILLETYLDLKFKKRSLTCRSLPYGSCIQLLRLRSHVVDWFHYGLIITVDKGLCSHKPIINPL